MNDQPPNTKKKLILTALFNPFHYVAGLQALSLGLLIILAAGFIGADSQSHFDGILDFHTGKHVPLALFMIEGVVDWLALASLLYVAGLLISKSRVRPLDVFGTQAMARFPSVIMAVCAFPPAYQRQAARLVSANPGAARGDAVYFAVAAFIIFLMIIWMAILMYQAFAVSCNVRGGKAVSFFIGALVLAEIAVKAILYGVMNLH